MFFIQNVGGRFCAVTQSGNSKPLDKDFFKYWSSVGGVGFFDLVGDGPRLILFLNGIGVPFELFGGGLKILRLAVGGFYIKDCSSFWINSGSDFRSFFSEMGAVMLFCKRWGGPKISDRNFVGLACLANGLIKDVTGGVDVASLNHQAVASSFFGGRRELFLDDNTQSVKYDIPSAYPGSLSKPLPRKLAYTKGAGIGDEGFHLIDFQYNGGSLAPRLPVRGGGGVMYAAGGRGWYWYEEIAKFKGLGGCVSAPYESLISVESGYYLKPAMERLMSSKAAGCKLSKPLMSCIFGKLAARDVKAETSYKLVDEANLCSIQGSYLSYGNLVIYEKALPSHIPQKTKVLAWAAIASSRTRADVMGIIGGCEELGRRIIGVKTDCVYVGGEGFYYNGLKFS